MKAGSLCKKLFLIQAKELENPVYEALKLFNMSEIHRYWSVADLDRLLIPPLEIDQCIFASRNNSIIGFCTWGLFSNRVSNGFANRSHLLQREDWKSGDNLWIVDLISPYGDVRLFAQLLYVHFLELYPYHQKAFAVRQYKGKGKHRRIASFSRRNFSAIEART
jgi:hemolysin-activating ACP:hemolysin acyltransferase